MLKISTMEIRNQRRLVLEGKLIWPWTTELRRACEDAWKNLEGRELIIDLKNLTVISQEGEYLLAELMNEGIKVRSSGVFAKQVVRQLARQGREHTAKLETSQMGRKLWRQLLRLFLIQQRVPARETA
jgi:hypothetical protein